jgi:hypothetical protein
MKQSGAAGNCIRTSKRSFRGRRPPDTCSRSINDQVVRGSGFSPPTPRSSATDSSTELMRVALAGHRPDEIELGKRRIDRVLFQGRCGKPTVAQTTISGRPSEHAGGTRVGAARWARTYTTSPSAPGTNGTAVLSGSCSLSGGTRGTRAPRGSRRRGHRARSSRSAMGKEDSFWVRSQSYFTSLIYQTEG